MRRSAAAMILSVAACKSSGSATPQVVDLRPTPSASAASADPPRESWMGAARVAFVGKNHVVAQGDARALLIDIGTNAKTAIDGTLLEGDPPVTLRVGAPARSARPLGARDGFLFVRQSGSEGIVDVVVAPTLAKKLTLTLGAAGTCTLVERDDHTVLCGGEKKAWLIRLNPLHVIVMNDLAAPPRTYAGESGPFATYVDAARHIHLVDAEDAIIATGDRLDLLTSDRQRAFVRDGSSIAVVDVKKRKVLATFPRRGDESFDLFDASREIAFGWEGARGREKKLHVLDLRKKTHTVFDLATARGECMYRSAAIEGTVLSVRRQCIEGNRFVAFLQSKDLAQNKPFVAKEESGGAKELPEDILAPLQMHDGWSYRVNRPNAEVFYVQKENLYPKELLVRHEGKLEVCDTGSHTCREIGRASKEMSVAFSEDADRVAILREGVVEVHPLAAPGAWPQD